MFMNLLEWTLWYSIIPSCLSFIYIGIYSVYDQPNENNSVHFTNSLKRTLVHLFITPNIILVPFLLDTNYVTSDFIEISTDKIG